MGEGPIAQHHQPDLRRRAVAVAGLAVPASELEYGFYELKVSAKRERGSKLKAIVTFQHC